MIRGIILAGGKGTRMNSKDVNKVSLPYLGKPMICYGVELLEEVCDEIVVVIGAYAESVKDALKDHQVTYAYQKELLGTGHAVQMALAQVSRAQDGLPAGKAGATLIGYGDHMMFYKKETVEKMLALHQKEQAALTLITTEYADPIKLAWGRIVRNSEGSVVGCVEQKDATEEQKQITELNVGFYCVDSKFLEQNIQSLTQSKATGEYYLTEIMEIAAHKNAKIAALKIPFQDVGIGVNTAEELNQSSQLYTSLHTKS